EADGQTTRDERLTPLVRMAGALRQQSQPRPRSEYATDLRERLLAAADEVGVADRLTRPSSSTASMASGPVPRARRVERRLGAVIAAVVLVGGTAGFAHAAQHALPGSALYPLKQGIESVEVTLHTGQA